jgi:parallel beta-helix repeat protein
MITVLMTVSLVAPVVDAATYYVAKGGNNANSGTQDAPWLTIQKAEEAMTAGDTVVVQPGEYAEHVSINMSGTSEARITYRTEGSVTMKGFALNADHISIQGFQIINLDDNAVGIRVANSGFCVIENNAIRYTTMGGITLEARPDQPAGVHDCVVRNNTLFRNGQFGLEIMGTRNLVENNEVAHTVQHHPCNVRYRSESWLDADGIRFHGDGHVLSGNRVHSIEYGGSGWDSGTPCSLASLEDLSIDLNDEPHIDCFQTFGPAGSKVPASNIVLERNHCNLPDFLSDGSLAGKGFQIAEATDITIKNNVAIHNLSALVLDSAGISFLHNTFYGNPDSGFSEGVKFTNSRTSLVKNNIFAYQESGIGSIWANDSQSAAGLNAGFNCVYRQGGKPNREPDPGDVWDINPLFVGEPGDLHLQPGSPCIDAGATDLGVNDDYEGTVRPQGNGYDIGGYELAGVATPTPPAFGEESLLRTE